MRLEERTAVLAGLEVKTSAVIPRGYAWMHPDTWKGDARKDDLTWIGFAPLKSGNQDHCDGRGERKGRQASWRRNAAVCWW